MEIQQIVEAQRAYYESGATQPLQSRTQALDRLLDGLTRYEDRLAAALQQDLGKAPFESYMTELGLVRDELRWQRGHIKRYAKPRRAVTPLAQFKAKSVVSPRPYGVVLVMAPWNYPVQLSLEPLIGAVAAGNCVVLKPSDYAPQTARVLAALVAECFDSRHAAVVLGGRQQNQDLLDQRFDRIFFTGGEKVGRLVLEKAARHLTPVTLELGGKSPCIVTKSADLALAARRIVFGKFLNAGQTCVAPDYLLVQRDVQPQLVELLGREIGQAFGPDPLACGEYPKIVNDKHFARLLGLLEGQNVVFGGRHDPAARRIEPTVLTEVSPQAPIMQEEIFGPLLPVLTYDKLEEAMAFVAAREHPLALYLFTTDKAQERQVLDRLQFGGGCVNDTIIHLATSHMPFGGVGRSGMGSYHGKQSFDTFTHYRSIVKKSNRIDLPVRYHPYDEKKFALLRRFLR